MAKKEIHLCMELVPKERFCRTNIQNSDMVFLEYLGILNFSAGFWKYNHSWYVLRSNKVIFSCNFELNQIFYLESSNFRILCNLKFQNWKFGIPDALLFNERCIWKNHFFIKSSFLESRFWIFVICREFCSVFKI